MNVEKESLAKGLMYAISKASEDGYIGEIIAFVSNARVLINIIGSHTDRVGSLKIITPRDISSTLPFDDRASEGWHKSLTNISKLTILKSPSEINEFAVIKNKGSRYAVHTWHLLAGGNDFQAGFRIESSDNQSGNDIAESFDVIFNQLLSKKCKTVFSSAELDSVVAVPVMTV